MPLSESLVTFSFPVPEEDLTRIYLAVIHEPESTRESLIAAGHPPDAVDTALQVLRIRGLVEVVDGVIEVAPPEGALTAFTAEVERQVRRIRASASQLGMIHRRARDHEASRDNALRARALDSVADIRSASQAIVADAEHSILSLRAASPRTTQLLTSTSVDHDGPNLDSAGNPIRGLAVYDKSVLDTDGVVAVLRRRQAAGEQVRIADNIPFSVVVVDERDAVIDLSNINETGSGSAAISNGPLITALTRLVEAFYARGVPLPDQRSDTDVGGLGARDHTILTLLAAGTSDATVARQLGVSVRTVERRIRQIMDHLGASSRLQAGAEAVRRGLI